MDRVLQKAFTTLGQKKLTPNRCSGQGPVANHIQDEVNCQKGNFDYTTSSCEKQEWSVYFEKS